MNPPRGLCATHAVDLWCSDRAGDRALAKAICGVCPEAEACADYARRLEGSVTWAYGIFGGLDEAERHGQVSRHTTRKRAGWRQRKAAA